MKIQTHKDIREAVGEIEDQQRRVFEVAEAAKVLGLKDLCQRLKGVSTHLLRASVKLQTLSEPVNDSEYDKEVEKSK